MKAFSSLIFTVHNCCNIMCTVQFYSYFVEGKLNYEHAVQLLRKAFTIIDALLIHFLRVFVAGMQKYF